MNRIGVLLALFILTTCTAQAATRTFGNVTITPPVDYRIDEVDGWLRLKKEAGNEFVEVRILQGSPLVGSVEAHAQRFEELIKQNNPTDFREEAPIQTMQPKNAERVACLNVSARNPHDATTFTHFVAFFYQAGGRVETIVINSISPKFYERERTTINNLLNTMKLASAEQLAAGEPPLTRYTIDRTCGFVEWLLEVPLTGDQRTRIQKEMMDTWQKNDRGEIDGVAEMLRGMDELAARPEADRKLVREQARQTALQQWRASANPTERMLADIYDAANKPIIEGTPPLTRQIASATAEAFYLMACAVEGIEFQTPDEDLTKQFTGKLAEQYPNMDRPARDSLTQMPVFTAAMRVAWSQMDQAEKDAYVAQWKQIPGIQELGRKLHETATAKFTDNMARMQAMQAQYRMMSNILQMQQDTSRIIISNMGGNTRWEYRW